MFRQRMMILPSIAVDLAPATCQSGCTTATKMQNAAAGFIRQTAL
jgi:hypothetical protein